MTALTRVYSWQQMVDELCVCVWGGGGLNTNTHLNKHPRTHAPTHPHNLHAKFQSPWMKTVAAKEWGIFVDQPTDRATNRSSSHGFK